MPVIGKDDWTLLGIGADGSIMLNKVPVPEPSTMLLFGIGLAGFANATRKKLKK